MIKGNINGIKKTILEKMENLFDLTIDKNYILSGELVENLNDITKLIKKEICVIVNRSGIIIDIFVGNVNSVKFSFIDNSNNKLSGLRVIHTHPNGISTLSSMDISTLTSLKLDAIAALGVSTNSDNISIDIGFCDVLNNTLTSNVIENLTLDDCMKINFKDKINHIDNSLKSLKHLEDSIDRAILVGTAGKESLLELVNLAIACDVVPVHKVLQKRSNINSAYYAGEGKVKEIAYLKQLKNANIVIFDDELSGSQIRNLEDTLDCKVIDRTTLILDIFAKRASTKEGMLQVELAMLNHKLPRLRDSNANLARIKGGVGMKGGIGSRGPGEKKLESDKRHIENRIEEIKKELSKVVNIRTVQRTKRNKNNMSNVAIVGYTNAGKSTLRNKLCKIASYNNTSKKSVLEADMLFATLDTTVRAITLNDSRKITLSDTVGFINKLPHELVEAFKSTLEEVVDADLLLHVVDASNKNAINQINSVNNVLNELNCIDKNTIIVLNKTDIASYETLLKLKEFLKDKVVIEVSALNGTNLKNLLNTIANKLPNNLIEKEFIIPYNYQKLISILHENSNIIEKKFIDEGTYIKTLIDENLYKKYNTLQANAL